MMKLSKTQIQYIEDYLIKNEVKYWDVRLELIDHIASAVEEKMSIQNVSFIEALAIVHREFGNQLMPPKYEGVYYLEKSLYQANNGFKKHIKEKQKELGVKYRKGFAIVIKKQFYSFNFYLQIVLLAFVIFTIYTYSQKAALLSVFFFLIGLEVMKFVEFFKNYSFLKNALQFNVALVFTGMFYSSQFYIIKGYESLFSSKELIDYKYLLVFYVLMFVFLRASLIHFIKFFRDYKKCYKNLISL